MAYLNPVMVLGAPQSPISMTPQALKIKKTKTVGSHFWIVLGKPEVNSDHFFQIFSNFGELCRHFSTTSHTTGPHYWFQVI